MTSAPISAKIIVANGPAMKWEKSTTRIPSRAFGASDGRGACSGNSASMLSSMLHPFVRKVVSAIEAARRRASISLGLLEHRASVLVDGAKRLGPAQDADILEKIPLALRGLRLLHLQNVHIVDGATIRPNDDRAKERVIDWLLLHLSN